MKKKEEETYEYLFNDFLHPNPNINRTAASRIRELWPQRFKKDLIRNA